MKVALARKADLGAVLEIGSVAVSDAYRELLRPATVEAMLSTAYSLPALLRRWEDHPIFVAWDGHLVVGFADAFVEDDRVVVSALCSRPGHRRKGVGRRLLAAVGELAAMLPLTVDVVLGNRDAEAFYEHEGFVPGEILEISLFDERVVERRWYHSPLVESASGSFGASSSV